MFFPLFSIIEIVPAGAQNAGWGLITGTTLSQVRISTSDRCDNTSWLFGTSVGAMADMPFTWDVSIQPVLQFLQKGGQGSEDFDHRTIRLNYLELPINLVYHGNGKHSQIVIGMGLSFSYGLYGTGKIPLDGQVRNISIKFANSPDDLLRPLEVGINALAGYEWKNGIFFQCNVNRGFNNVYNQNPSDPHAPLWSNIYFGLRVGYLISNTKVWCPLAKASVKYSFPMAEIPTLLQSVFNTAAGRRRKPESCSECINSGRPFPGGTKYKVVNQSHKQLAYDWVIGYRSGQYHSNYSTNGSERTITL